MKARSYQSKQYHWTPTDVLITLVVAVLAGYFVFLSLGLTGNSDNSGRISAKPPANVGPTAADNSASPRDRSIQKVTPTRLTDLAATSSAHSAKSSAARRSHIPLGNSAASVSA